MIAVEIAWAWWSAARSSVVAVDGNNPRCSECCAERLGQNIRKGSISTTESAVCIAAKRSCCVRSSTKSVRSRSRHSHIGAIHDDHQVLGAILINADWLREVQCRNIDTTRNQDCLLRNLGQVAAVSAIIGSLEARCTTVKILVDPDRRWKRNVTVISCACGSSRASHCAINTKVDATDVSANCSCWEDASEGICSCSTTCSASWECWVGICTSNHATSHKVWIGVERHGVWTRRSARSVDRSTTRNQDWTCGRC